MAIVFIIGIIILLIIIFNNEAKEIRQANIRREKAHAAEEKEKQSRLLKEKEQAKQLEQTTALHQRQQAEQQELLQKQQAEEALELQLCEANTVYANSLHLLYITQGQNLNFNAIRSISVEVINQLSEPVKNQLHQELDSGVAVLMSENHLHAYHFAFGLMHQAKLTEAFQECYNRNYLDLHRQKIEIIDYGCGQGIGTIVFIDFLKYNNITCTIKQVTLIEPSTLAIKRASLNVRYALRCINQNENVFTINKTLDNINESHLKTKDNTIKIHLLSNIIDVEDFQLSRLCHKISGTQKGENIFICVSPKFWRDDVHSRNLRLDTFLFHFQQNYPTTIISQRDSDIKIGGKIWTRYEKIFYAIMPVINKKTNSLSFRTRKRIADDDLPF